MMSMQGGRGSTVWLIGAIVLFLGSLLLLRSGGTEEGGGVAAESDASEGGKNAAQSVVGLPGGGKKAASSKGGKRGSKQPYLEPEPWVSAAWRLRRAINYPPFRRQPNNKWNADDMWRTLLPLHPNPEKAIIVEVGAFDGNQCAEAARVAKWKKVICFEPSPKNFPKCEDVMKKAKKNEPEVAARMEMLQLAIGADPVGELEFHMTDGGGPGDHAGMVRVGELDEYKKSANDVTVQATNLDTFLARYVAAGDEIYIVKIDTQGFEGFGLLGMRELLLRSLPKYIIFEFWPLGMRTAGHSCRRTLRYLSGLNYHAYEGPLMALTYLSQIDIDKPIPGGVKEESYRQNWNHKGQDIESVCHWYESRPEGGPKDQYGMQTDVLLVRKEEGEE